jgi:hypothetical protein
LAVAFTLQNIFIQRCKGFIYYELLTCIELERQSAKAIA